MCIVTGVGKRNTKQKEKIMAYQVCSHCAAVLVNGDLTSLEFSFGAEDMARIEARIESMGLVTMTETVDPGWWFDCDLCEETCLGEICTFERV